MASFKEQLEDKFVINSILSYIKDLWNIIKMNDETDLLLHSQLAFLACNEELANELLGEDDFMKNSIDEFPLVIAAKRFNPDNKAK